MGLIGPFFAFLALREVHCGRCSEIPYRKFFRTAGSGGVRGGEFSNIRFIASAGPSEPAVSEKRESRLRMLNRPAVACSKLTMTRSLPGQPRLPNNIDSEFPADQMVNAVVAAATWRCPSCASTVSTAYCPDCGERPLDPRYLTFRGLIAQFARFLIHLDHRIVNSFRCMIMQPGQLTVAFERGQRQGYLGPFKLFVLANLVFFALQSTTDLRVFSTELGRQISGEEGTDAGRALVHQYLDDRNLSLELYEPIYDQAVAMHARSLIGLMVLPFALFLPLIFWRNKKPFAVHVVFSVHFFAFVLLLYSLPAAGMAIAAIVTKQAHWSQTTDNILTVAILISLGGFLFSAIQRVYQAHGVSRGVQTLLLTVAYILCFLGYRFVLVPITLYAP